MVNASRDSAGGKNVTLVYFLERHGNMTPALSAVAAINTFGLQEVVLRLGKIIYVKAEGEIFFVIFWISYVVR